jgi:hypothetical protein
MPPFVAQLNAPLSWLKEHSMPGTQVGTTAVVETQAVVLSLTYEHALVATVVGVMQVIVE